MVLIQTPWRLYLKNHAPPTSSAHGRNQRAGVDAPEFAKYNQGDVVGKFGTRSSTTTLMGGRAAPVVVDNAAVRQTLATRRRWASKDLQRFIDLGLQTVASELAMEGRMLVVALALG